jgi:putative N6-adenine-specific DNA methylase
MYNRKIGNIFGGMQTNTDKYIAKTLSGLEYLLADELKALGASEISIGVRSVSFSASKEGMYSINLWSRTALRILRLVASFTCESEEKLYTEIKKIPWEHYLSVDDTFAIDAVAYRSVLNHSLYIAQKAKDAIADTYREKTGGKRPSVDLDHPSLRIHVHISENQATVSLDSSGSSLHRRGYREYGNEAPLNEALAAGIILLSGWNKETSFVDFMCGSGTLLIEAALIARNIAPGIFRKEFGFEKWKDFDPQLWQDILKEAKEAGLSALETEITGCDESGSSIKVARMNIRNAGLEDDIDLFKMSFQDFTPPRSEGTIIVNPPYGERLNPADLNNLYREIGDFLKKKCAGYTAWVFTGNMEAAKHIGLRTSKRITLFNGPIECRLLKYELYQGSKQGVGSSV